MDKLTRREFMAVSAASVIVTHAGKSMAQTAASGKLWYATMRRCGQLNFNERDPLTLNADAWMDYWASLKVNAVLLNGGGIVAFYPTKIPYQHRSEFLGQRDLFGDMAVAARKRGIRVVARMDCNYAYQESLEAHPEWFERNRDGSPRRQDECPWLFKTCMFSTYFTEQMPAIYREMNERYSPTDSLQTAGQAQERWKFAIAPRAKRSTAKRLEESRRKPRTRKILSTGNTTKFIWAGLRKSGNCGTRWRRRRIRTQCMSETLAAESGR